MSTIEIVYHREIKFLSTLLARLLDFIFPARCVGCNARGHYLCARCLERAPEADSVELPDSFALFTYDYAPIKRAVWLLKYRGARTVAKPLGQALYGRLIEYLADALALYPGEQDKQWLVIPIPLSAKRLRERGFNQAEHLARQLATRDTTTFQLAPKILTKIIHTPTQVSIKDRRARLANLAGAFVVTDKNAVTGRNIILVDDVITTGATITEAKRTLLAAGARRIIGIAVAHG